MISGDAARALAGKLDVIRRGRFLASSNLKDLQQASAALVALAERQEQLEAAYLKAREFIKLYGQSSSLPEDVTERWRVEADAMRDTLLNLKRADPMDPADGDWPPQRKGTP